MTVYLLEIQVKHDFTHLKKEWKQDEREFTTS